MYESSARCGALIAANRESVSAIPTHSVRCTPSLENTPVMGFGRLGSLLFSALGILSCSCLHAACWHYLFRRAGISSICRVERSARLAVIRQSSEAGVGRVCSEDEDTNLDDIEVSFNRRRGAEAVLSLRTRSGCICRHWEFG